MAHGIANTAHMMSNESLRAYAMFGVDLNTVKARARIEAAIARAELNARDMQVIFAA